MTRVGRRRGVPNRVFLLRDLLREASCVGLLRVRYPCVVLRLLRRLLLVLMNSQC
jgi:hypothetical protein